jgi:deoxyribonuclease-4
MEAQGDKKNNLLLGAHLSIAGGLHKALESARKLGCNAVQIFTKNASTWREKTLTEKQISTFDQTRRKTGINKIASHTSYLINPAGSDAGIRKKSASALKEELIRCRQLKIPWLVMHPGSHTGQGISAGIKSLCDTVNDVFQQLPESTTCLLLETTAGQGTCLGHSFDQLAEMIHGIKDKNRIGICLDTCHIFAAGYDISTRQGYDQTMDEFHKIIGLKHLRLIHANDAQKPCGSRVDRHAHIGEGMIGDKGFSCLINDKRLADIPKILETPKKKDGKDADPLNLARLRKLLRPA